MWTIFISTIILLIAEYKEGLHYVFNKTLIFFAKVLELYLYNYRFSADMVSK